LVDQNVHLHKYVRHAIARFRSGRQLFFEANPETPAVTANVEVRMT
jgi:hypothetical protein